MMIDREARFRFGLDTSAVRIEKRLPSLGAMLSGTASASSAASASGAAPERSAVRQGLLLVCDKNTEPLARRILGDERSPLCVLEAGEEAKGWASVQAILEAAVRHGLGRDGLFVGVGGGVVTDLTAFAAAVYMRGARVSLVSTTLLGMVDAALGGKTGFDLMGIKNLVGAFKPAESVSMPMEALRTLPQREWKSGLAEAIKTAILGDEVLLDMLEKDADRLGRVPGDEGSLETAADLVERCVRVKGRIVESDPQETGTERALLNLGHTFGHALEAAAGLGSLTHGEAVAWGTARACELGASLGITPAHRARRIVAILSAYGYALDTPSPKAPDSGKIIAAMASDKKKQGSLPRFIVPLETGARIVSIEDGMERIRRVLEGAYTSLCS